MSDAVTALVVIDGVFPEGFYATTNFETHVQVGGQWRKVERIEMDVGVKVEGADLDTRAVALNMHHARKDD